MKLTNKEKVILKKAIDLSNNLCNPVNMPYEHNVQVGQLFQFILSILSKLENETNKKATK